jgi:hypothetical protein
MGGSSGGGGAGTSVSRYSPYVEAAHNALIAEGDRYFNLLLRGVDDGIAGLFDDDTPYDITVTDPDNSFFGTGLGIASYDGMFEIFEEYTTDVDIDSLYTTIQANMIGSSAITDDISAEADLLDDEIDLVGLPRINAGSRDINSVMSTGFTHAKALLEDTKIKALTKYSASLKKHAMDQSLQRWTETMNWNIAVHEAYTKLYQLYWATYFDYLDTHTDFTNRHKLWPFTVLDMQRGLVATLQGGIPSPQSAQSNKASKMSAVLGGAALGAKIGTAVNPGIGTAIGGVVGGIAGAFA